jgi:hypothetical protein
MQAALDSALVHAVKIATDKAPNCGSTTFQEAVDKSSSCKKPRVYGEVWNEGGAAYYLVQCSSSSSEAHVSSRKCVRTLEKGQPQTPSTFSTFSPEKILVLFKAECDNGNYKTPLTKHYTTTWKFNNEDGALFVAMWNYGICEDSPLDNRAALLRLFQEAKDGLPLLESQAALEATQTAAKLAELKQQRQHLDLNPDVPADLSGFIARFTNSESTKDTYKNGGTCLNPKVVYSLGTVDVDDSAYLVRCGSGSYPQLNSCKAGLKTDSEQHTPKGWKIYVEKSTGTFIYTKRDQVPTTALAALTYFDLKVCAESPIKTAGLGRSRIDYEVAKLTPLQTQLQQDKMIVDNLSKLDDMLRTEVISVEIIPAPTSASTSASPALAWDDLLLEEYLKEMEADLAQIFH